MDHDPAADLALLQNAAREACAVAMAAFRPGEPPVGRRWRKPGDDSPVTEADLAVNAALRETLTAARPRYGWLSEEDPDDGARLDARRVFIIDPIDGTRAFARGARDFSVCAAVVEAGWPIAAIVAAPARDAVYAASAGGGATVTSTSAGVRRLSAAEPPEAVLAHPALAGVRIVARQVDLRPEVWPGGAPKAERGRVVSMALRMCMAASGAEHAMLTLRPAHEWDVAPGALIATEAGACVTDQTGALLRFNRPEPRAPGVLAAPPRLHAALLARLR